MFFSEKYNLLFIACPKTGSRSVEKYLLDIDPNGERHKIVYNNKSISAKDMPKGLLGHAKANDIKETLGAQDYDKLSVFGMVRHPFDKLVSSYFYAKSQRIIPKNFKAQKWFFLKYISRVITHTMPRILPINIWVLFFPLRTSYDYFHDKNGNRLVEYIGRTDYLSQDLNAILNQLGISNKNDIPHVNKSAHKSQHKYFTNKFIRKYLKRKYLKDIELYELAEKEMLAISKDL